MEDYPELALELDNLVSACHNCHEKTKNRKRGKVPPARVIRM